MFANFLTLQVQYLWCMKNKYIIYIKIKEYFKKMLSKLISTKHHANNIAGTLTLHITGFVHIDRKFGSQT